MCQKQQKWPDGSAQDKWHRNLLIKPSPRCPMSVLPFSEPCPAACSWPYTGMQAEAAWGAVGSSPPRPAAWGSGGLVQPGATPATRAPPLLLTPLGRPLDLSHGLGRVCVPQPACAPLCCPALLALPWLCWERRRPGALPPAHGVGAAAAHGCL